MTTKYLEDSYCATILTYITGIGLIKGTTYLTLNDLIFHPEGGGQPADSGTLEIKGVSFRYQRLLKANRDVRIVFSEKLPIHDELFPGAEVKCHIDWPARYRLMKMHTSAHLLMACARRIHPEGFSPKGIDLNENGIISLNFLSQLEGTQTVAQNILDLYEQGRSSGAKTSTMPVGSVDEGRAIFPSTFRVANEINIQPPIRVVVIDAWDANPCGGTHVASTTELDKLKIEHIEKSDGLIHLQASSF